MSEFSESINHALENLGGDGPGPFKLVHVQGGSENPFEDAILLHHRNGSMMMLRRAYRHHTGRVFPSTQAALDETEAKVISEYIPVLTTLLADFIQLGTNTSPAIFLCEMMKRPDLLPTNGAWQQESMKLVEMISEDEDTLHLLLHYTQASAHALSHITGYLRDDAETDHIDKIWNLWGMVFSSTFIAFSKVGMMLGEKLAEEARIAQDKKVLDEIAAHEFKPEGDADA